MMSTITVSLSQERLLKLQEVAGRYGVTPEDLIKLSVEDLLAQPDEAFQRALDYVLDKNSELYKRLAA
jgi:hypothetical protein